MYDRTFPGRMGLKPNFIVGVEGFISWAFAQELCRSEGGVRCPCLKCECRPIISDPQEITAHLHRRGFIANYWVWTFNGEELSSNVPETSNSQASSSRPPVEYEENFNLIGDMVEDAFGVNVTYDEPEDFGGEEMPNEEAQKFYQLLNEMNTPLFGGPVQYRWMYPFERFMGDSKRSVKNKARVEGSICAHYLHRETSHFC